MAEDQPKALAERLIAWASIAYGCGFLIVLIHTARLGVPVLELVKPVYILIGLPLAALGYFSRQIVSWIRATALASRDEVVSALREPYISSKDEQSVNVDKFLQAFSQAVPWYFSVRPLAGVSSWLLHRVLDREQPHPDRLAAWTGFLDRNARILLFYAALIRLLNRLILIAAIGLVLGLYVWDVYPKLPLAYGGGAPMNVRLLLDTSKLPSDLPYLTGPAGPASAKVGERAKAFLTPPLELLYITSTDFLVRAPTGSVVALDRDVVTGVVYRDGKAPLPSLGRHPQ